MESCRVEVRLAWAGLGFGVFYSIVHTWVFGWGESVLAWWKVWTGRDGYWFVSALFWVAARMGEAAWLGLADVLWGVMDDGRENVY